MPIKIFGKNFKSIQFFSLLQTLSYMHISMLRNMKPPTNHINLLYLTCKNLMFGKHFNFISVYESIFIVYKHFELKLFLDYFF